MTKQIQLSVIHTQQMLELVNMSLELSSEFFPTFLPKFLPYFNFGV